MRRRYNGKALLSGFEFEKQKFMKELQELIKDLQLQMNYCCYDAEMLNKLSGVWEVVHKLVDLSQNLQQCIVSGSSPVDFFCLDENRGGVVCINQCDLCIEAGRQ